MFSVLSLARGRGELRLRPTSASATDRGRHLRSVAHTSRPSSRLRRSGRCSQRLRIRVQASRVQVGEDSRAGLLRVREMQRAAPTRRRRVAKRWPPSRGLLSESASVRSLPIEADLGLARATVAAVPFWFTPLRLGREARDLHPAAARARRGLQGVVPSDRRAGVVSAAATRRVPYAQAGRPMSSSTRLASRVDVAAATRTSPARGAARR